MKRMTGLLFAAWLGVIAQAGTKTTYLVDFGAPEHLPYAFRSGDFGLTAPPVVVSRPETGEYSGFGYTSLTYRLGAVTLSFPRVGGYNLVETDEAPLAALVASFLFSSASRDEVGSPVAFTITTRSPGDRVTVSAIGGVQTGHRAVVTLKDWRYLVTSSEQFTALGTELTGQTTYMGSFEAEEPEADANLGAFLVVVETE